MYQFTEDCMVGITQIDEEHRRLFEMINETQKLLQEKHGSVASAKNLVKKLKEYAQVHFAHEEQYMEKTNDPELEMQKTEHAEFRKKIEQISLEDADEEEAKKIISDLLEFLARWLYHHILGSDIMIGKLGSGVEKDPFAFTEEYWTGIELIDDEHKKLFDIIRETNDIIHAQFLHDKYDEIMRILHELQEYTERHFKDEEDYMERIDYKRIEVQKRAHEAFVDKIKKIDLREIDDNQEEYLEELIDYLLKWLSNHILKMDKKIPQAE